MCGMLSLMLLESSSYVRYTPTHVSMNGLSRCRLSVLISQYLFIESSCDARVEDVAILNSGLGDGDGTWLGVSGT